LSLDCCIKHFTDGRTEKNRSPVTRYSDGTDAIEVVRASTLSGMLDRFRRHVRSACESGCGSGQLDLAFEVARLDEAEVEHFHEIRDVAASRQKCVRLDVRDGRVRARGLGERGADWRKMWMTRASG